MFQKLAYLRDSKNRCIKFQKTIRLESIYFILLNICIAIWLYSCIDISLMYELQNFNNSHAIVNYGTRYKSILKTFYFRVPFTEFFIYFIRIMMIMKIYNLKAEE